MSENRRFLENVAIFGGLSGEELDTVAGMFKERRYGKNETVFLEEETGNYMYVVKEGRVKVSRVLPSGKETTLAFHEAGEYFGEMSLIDGQTAPATVTALVPTTILVITSREFESLLAKTGVVRTLLETLCKRCRDAWAQVSILAFNHADARIRTALYLLSQDKGEETEKGLRINLQLTHRELAEVAGISRETVTRVLGQLQSQGTLAVEKGHFLILDPEKLVDPLLLE